MDLTRLSDFFSPSEIEWRLGMTNKAKTKGLALPYITSRGVQRRLDDVCGAENWKNDFKPWKEKSQLCGISIKTSDEWVTKWDGADDPKTEPTKGGLSDAMKRSAVMWGIGRYLYELPAFWVDIEPMGNSYKISKYPLLPKNVLPKGAENENGNYSIDEPMANDDVEFDNIINPNVDVLLDNAKKSIFVNYIVVFKLELAKVLKYYKVKTAEDLTVKQFMDFRSRLMEQFDVIKCDEEYAKLTGVTKSGKGG